MLHNRINICLYRYSSKQNIPKQSCKIIKKNTLQLTNPIMYNTFLLRFYEYQCFFFF